MKIKIALKTLF